MYEFNEIDEHFILPHRFECSHKGAISATEKIFDLSRKTLGIKPFVAFVEVSYTANFKER
jgi:hypothetical protein